MSIMSEPDVDPANSLALAMVTTSDTPLLMLDGELNVLAASGSFCRTFALDPTLVVGNSILSMGDGEWNLSRLESLLVATGSGGVAIDKYEIDLPGGAGESMRSLELSVHKLDYVGAEKVRLLLTINETTSTRAFARQREALVAENLLLMKELQHRIANSLQIIASILMQSARRVSNDETRNQLQMAQSRVISVAEIQRQLSQTGASGVELRPYLTQLCRSIGTSMIADPKLLSIEIDVDDSSVTATKSVSLGLIVTELIINSLKHAYPIDSGGKIIVHFRSVGDGWVLEIEDDGVGMPARGPAETGGLGTSIIEALARQLEARIIFSDAKPGTSVALVHDGAGKNQSG